MRERERCLWLRAVVLLLSLAGGEREARDEGRDAGADSNEDKESEWMQQIACQ